MLTPPVRPSHAPDFGSSTVGEAIRYESELLWSIRQFLRAHEFVELITPTFRQSDDLTGKRATADVAGRGWLRSMIGPALRYNLQYVPRVFEIGACFRPEPADATHRAEFTMLDLYSSSHSFDDLVELAEGLVGLAYAGPVVRISVAQHIHDRFGVDLSRSTVDTASTAIAKHIGQSPDTPVDRLLEAYIAAEFEPMTSGRAALLADLPLGGNEPCAKVRDGTTGILDRFELFIDGIEVVHGYRDEPDTTAFVERASAIGLYNQEQGLVQEQIHAGTLPADSVGLGMGIERLCMAATRTYNIAPFRQSACY